jgi:hypothetical protein
MRFLSPLRGNVLRRNDCWSASRRPRARTQAAVYRHVFHHWTRLTRRLQIRVWQDFSKNPAGQQTPPRRGEEDDQSKSESWITSPEAA